MHWYLVERTDTRARLLADRHYSRKSPGHPEFCPPGDNIVLIVPTDNASAARALWVSHRPNPAANLDRPRFDGLDYWDNPYFRNESGLTSSLLIVEALSITRYLWRDHLPRDGFHSFVDARQVRGVKVRGQLVHGFVFQKAGFRLHPIRTSKSGLLRWVLPLDDLLAISPARPLEEQMRLAI